jgi:hypothetical protein
VRSRFRFRYLLLLLFLLEGREQQGRTSNGGDDGGAWDGVFSTRCGVK